MSLRGHRRWLEGPDDLEPPAGCCSTCWRPLPCGHVVITTADGKAPNGAVLTPAEFAAMSRPLPGDWTVTEAPAQSE